MGFRELLKQKEKETLEDYFKRMELTGQFFIHFGELIKCSGDSNLDWLINELGGEEN